MPSLCLSISVLNHYAIIIGFSATLAESPQMSYVFC